MSWKKLQAKQHAKAVKNYPKSCKNRHCRKMRVKKPMPVRYAGNELAFYISFKLLSQGTVFLFTLAHSQPA